MTQINPAGSGSITDRNPPTIQTTLSRIGRALTIRGASEEAPVQRGDSVQISKAAASASAATNIADIRVLLADLETLVAQAAQDNAGADIRAEAQRRIDAAVATISRIAGAGSVGEVSGRLDTAPGFSVVNRHNGVSGVVVDSSLKQDERVDVMMTLLHSAQIGGFFLSFGSSNIDLGTGSSFIIDVAGNLGNRQLSFASGTSLVDIAAAVNTFTDVIGVEALVSGTGIRLDSVGFGSDQFVAIQVIDDGTIVSGDGIHGYVADDTSTALNYLLSNYTNQDVHTDFGLDAGVEVNGVLAQVSGNTVSASLLGGRLDVEFDIGPDLGFINNEIPFGVQTRAFTVIGGQPDRSYLTDRSKILENISIDNRALGRGESFEVELVITNAAERGGAALILDGAATNPDESIEGEGVFRIGGRLGSVDVLFESGKTIADFVESINLHTESTGVQAMVSGSAIRIESTDLGDNQFVTLRTINSQGLDGTIGGIVTTAWGGANALHRYSIDSDFAKTTGVEDFGRDLEAMANGFDLTSDGRRIFGEARDGLLHFEFDIIFADGLFGLQTFSTPTHFDHPKVNPLNAFTIHGGVRDSGSTDAGSSVDKVPFLGSAQTLSIPLSPFVSTGENAGDFVSALDAIRSLRDQFGDGGITNESLAELRRDLIAQAGASLGVTAKSDVQQALDLLGGVITKAQSHMG